MNSSELERLLWERIDGELDEADRARLADLLATEPGGERLEAEIAWLAGEIVALEEQPAPEGLREDIARAIRPAADEGFTSAPEPWHAALSRLGGPRPVRRLAYLAATLLLALVGYQLVTQDVGPDTGALVGTAGLTPEGPLRLDLAGARGVLTLARQDNALRIGLETGPGFDAARLEVLGRDLRIGASDGLDPTPVSRSTDRGLEIDVAGSGSIELLVEIPSARQRIVVRVSSGAEVLGSHELEWEPE